MAVGVCDLEEAGAVGCHWGLGLLVGPDQWSPKHPQLMRKPTPVDPEALRDPRIDQAADGNDGNFFTVYTNVGEGILGTELTTYQINSGLGTVEVTTS